MISKERERALVASPELDLYLSQLGPADQPIARAHGEIPGDVWRARVGPQFDTMAERVEEIYAELHAMRTPWWRKAALGLSAVAGAAAAGFFGKGQVS
jgi:hypothetical protein